VQAAYRAKDVWVDLDGLCTDMLFPIVLLVCGCLLNKDKPFVCSKLVIIHNERNLLYDCIKQNFGFMA